MSKDLTISVIERQNILNNRLAIEEIASQLGIIGILFEGEYQIGRAHV